jgi:hypothetical protein
MTRKKKRTKRDGGERVVMTPYRGRLNRSMLDGRNGQVGGSRWIPRERRWCRLRERGPGWEEWKDSAWRRGEVVGSVDEIWDQVVCVCSDDVGEVRSGSG